MIKLYCPKKYFPEFRFFWFPKQRFLVFTLHATLCPVGRIQKQVAGQIPKYCEQVAGQISGGSRTKTPADQRALTTLSRIAI